MRFLFAIGLIISMVAGFDTQAGDAVQTLGQTAALPDESVFTVHPGQERQTIKGLGFEIQCDSIGSGNHGLPEATVSVPHDLVPSERQRLADEMLKGFRYCRLAGGLYWRGLDAEKNSCARAGRNN